MVLEAYTAALIAQPAIAPLHERREHGEQIGPLGGQPVALARALTGVAVVDVLKKPCGHEFTQPPRDDRLAGLGARDEVVEPRRAVEGLAQDEHRRLRADDIERPGHGAPVGPPGVAGLEAAGQVDRGIHRPQCT
jgi:hypothetical protein